MNGLFYLGHLVYLKNQINRRRRRFHNLIDPGKDCIDIDPRDAHLYDPKFINVWTNWHGQAEAYVIVPNPRFISKKKATSGYEQAKADMRAMTPEMRRVRKEIGVSLTWGNSGNIIGFRFENKWYGKQAIEELHENYVAERIMLG